MPPLGPEAYKAVFDHSREGMLFSAPDGRILAANAAAQRLLRMSEAEIVAGGRRRVTDPSDPRWAAIVEERARTGRVAGQVRMIRGDGTTFEGELNSVVFRTEAGEERACVIFRDVTERVLAERELAEREETYRFVVEHSGDAILRLDAEGICRWASPAANQVFGLPAGELVGGAPLRLMVHPDDADRVAGPRWRVLREGDTAPHAFRIRRPDGAVRWIENVGRPIHDRSGTVQEVIVVCRDVTERIIAERALAESEELHRALVEALPGAARLVVDDQLRVHFVAGAGLEAAGWTKGSVEGRVLSEVVPPEQWAVLAPRFAQAFRDGAQSFRIETDGRQFWTQIVPLAYRIGDLRFVMVVEQDVTERAELLRAAAEAEERFRRAFEDSPIGMALVGPDLLFERVNPRFAAMVGAAPGELSGVSLEGVFARRDWVRTQRLLAETAAGERGGFEAEHALLPRDGSPLWVQLNVTALTVGATVGAAVGAAAPPGNGDGASRAAAGAGGALADGHRVLMLQAVDVTERRRMTDELEFEANHDHLTGLLNRRSFERALDAHEATIARYGPEGALLMIDLDNFKAVNDTLGHAAGDQVLIEVARAIWSRLRGTDVVARLGGDEFAVLLPKATGADAAKVAEAIVEAIRSTVPAGAGVTASPSASVGAAAYSPALRGRDEIVAAADRALYAAKAAGRDRWAIF